MSDRLKIISTVSLQMMILTLSTYRVVELRRTILKPVGRTRDDFRLLVTLGT